MSNREAPPVVHPSDAAIADLKLILRGVPLRVTALGGMDSDEPGSPRGTARIVVPAELAQRALVAGSLVVADEDGTPLATLAGVSTGPGTGADGAAVVSGTVMPARPDDWQLPALDGRDPVVALRPLLAQEVAELSERRVGAVLVPQAEPSPDGIPGMVLLDAVAAALRGTDVQAVGLELGPPAEATSSPRWRSVEEALGGTALTWLRAEDPAWQAALMSLDDANAGQAGLPSATEDVLRRWRPPKASRGLVVFFTGLSGSGKSTLARALTSRLPAYGRTVSLLDGDLVRRLLSAGLGFDRAARDLNVRRIGFVAAEVARHGGIAVCAPIAPYAESRADVRRMARAVGDFVLIHVSTPLEECERRDVKGLYARARAGEIAHFTGITDPYEEPTDADVTVDTAQLSEEEALQRVLTFLEDSGWLPPEQHS